MRLLILYSLFIALIISTSTAHAMQPRIAIISPFNAQDPIESFIRDITQQTFFNTAQLILISNNPPALIEPIIELYQETFDNITYIRLPECSDSILLNYAIRAAKSPFLTIIKSGDYRDPQMLQEQLSALEEDATLDLVYSDFLVTNKKAGHNDDSKIWNWNAICLPEFKPELMYGTVIGSHYIWRADLHEKYGYFNESLTFTHEWEFWNRCAAQGSCYKKVEGMAGKLFFDYFASSPTFNNEEVLARYFEEERYVHATYGKHWNVLYDLPEKPFVIVIASYNNKLWYKRNLDSVFSQKYSNYRIIYIDDCSPDGTGNLVREYSADCHKESLITIIANTQRCKALANIYHAVHSCKKDEIIITLDGDDWLAHDAVLNHLNAVYQDPNVWLTYGQFQWFPNNSIGISAPIPNEVIKENNIRTFQWVTSHLRSFYAGLYQRIRKKDLMYQEQFFPMTWDLAIMFPMVEMTGSHCKFVSEILYIYNIANNINDHKSDIMQQITLEQVIRSQKPYQPLKNLFKKG